MSESESEYTKSKSYLYLVLHCLEVCICRSLVVAEHPTLHV